MSSLGYERTGYGSRGAMTKKRCNVCREFFPITCKRDQNRKCCSDSCRVIASRRRRQNQSSWGPPIPAELVYRALQQHSERTGETMSQLSTRLGWNSGAIHKMMTARPTIRLGTADKLLCAIDRVDVLHVELADWYFPKTSEREAA